jgi:hypothetical protein
MNNNYANANRGLGDQNYEVGQSFSDIQSGLFANHHLQIPRHLLQHTPRPWEVVFRMTERQLVSNTLTR